MKSYANGVGKNTAQFACGQAPTVSLTSLKIADSDQFGNNWNSIGAVDEVRIYNGVLSEAQVKKNFASMGGLAVEHSTEELALT